MDSRESAMNRNSSVIEFVVRNTACLGGHVSFGRIERPPRRVEWQRPSFMRFQLIILAIVGCIGLDSSGLEWIGTQQHQAILQFAICVASPRGEKNFFWLSQTKEIFENGKSTMDSIKIQLTIASTMTATYTQFHWQHIYETAKK